MKKIAYKYLGVKTFAFIPNCLNSWPESNPRNRKQPWNPSQLPNSEWKNKMNSEQKAIFKIHPLFLRFVLACASPLFFFIPISRRPHPARPSIRFFSRLVRPVRPASPDVYRAHRARCHLPANSSLARNPPTHSRFVPFPVIHYFRTFVSYAWHVDTIFRIYRPNKFAVRSCFRLFSGRPHREHGGGGSLFSPGRTLA